MIGKINNWFNFKVPHDDIGFGRDALILKIRNEISPYISRVTICDRPSANSNGLTQYNYDENHEGIRQRRVSVARRFDLTLSYAPFDRRFVTALANELERTHQMPGQCAEMASLAAVKLKDSAIESGMSVYTVQLPDCNHTIVLLSDVLYKSNDWVNWKREFNSSSIIVDLWQGALSPGNPEALISLAAKNTYTEKSPRALVQCKI